MGLSIDFCSRRTIVGIFPCDRPINVLTARTALFSSAVHFLLSSPLPFDILIVRMFPIGFKLNRMTWIVVKSERKL